MSTIMAMLVAGGMLAFAGVPALAQGAGSGPVGRSCAADIAKFCTEATHGGRKVRSCLEAHRAQVSDDCRAALDGTGGGRGMGRNRMQ